jgi:hypothetical protein
MLWSLRHSVVVDVQGACVTGPKNPNGMCTIDVDETFLQTNSGSGVTTPEDAGKLFITNLRIRQRPLETGLAPIPALGPLGMMVLVSNDQLWMKDVILEGNTLAPRGRGLDIAADVDVYMEGTIQFRPSGSIVGHRVPRWHANHVLPRCPWFTDAYAYQYHLLDDAMDLRVVVNLIRSRPM